MCVFHSLLSLQLVQFGFSVSLRLLPYLLATFTSNLSQKLSQWRRTVGKWMCNSIRHYFYQQPEKPTLINDWQDMPKLGREIIWEREPNRTGTRTFVKAKSSKPMARKALHFRGRGGKEGRKEREIGNTIAFARSRKCGKVLHALILPNHSWCVGLSLINSKALLFFNLSAQVRRIPRVDQLEAK